MIDYLATGISYIGTVGSMHGARRVDKGIGSDIR